MKEQPTHLVVVDDNAAVRRALVLRLSRAHDVKIIGDTGDLNTAAEIVRGLQPDVLLLESKRRDGASLRFCERVKDESAHPPRIVILTSFANEDERLSLLHLGINQYLLKDIDTEELIRVIREQARLHREDANIEHFSA